MEAPRSLGSGDLFDLYFRTADLDGDGYISGAELLLREYCTRRIWAFADSKKAGHLVRAEFYSALKLVTVAQSKRELTPVMVKAATDSPVSVHIPAPRINLPATPASQPRGFMPVSQAQGVASLPSTTAGVRGSQLGGHLGTGYQQVVQGRQTQFMGTPHSHEPTNSSQGMSAGGSYAPRPTSQPMPSDWLSGRSGSPSKLVNSQIPSGQSPYGLTAPSSTTNHIPRLQVTPEVSNHTTVGAPESAAMQRPKDSSAPPGAPASVAPSSQLLVNDSKELAASRIWASSDSLFGDVFAVASTEPKQQSTRATSSMGISSISTGIVSASEGTQAVVNQIPGPNQASLGQHPVGVHSHPFTPSSAGSVPAGSSFVTGNSNQPIQPQAPWPKMTPVDIQKYTKVFVQVDIDRDGKITGYEARNLFLSWRLPQEALKQIVDLSDQDNDTMLSLREFCIALYLMERYREGRSLPSVFPSTIIPSESMFSVPGQSVTPHGNASSGLAHGFWQQQLPGASRPPSIPKGNPPRPAHVSYGDATLLATQPKRKIPTLENHLVDQLSKEEQNSLRSKFKETTTVDKKVDELEKEIADSKRRIEFFRSKMQELVLYKSRCDNRYNEISERVSGDKRELESLAKKYEEKYKQSGNLGSKLTIEEATFRDIQEKKMEWYQTIVKYEEGSPDDSAIKERTGSIQSGLEDLIKTLNERCKQYGLCGKPTSLVELPFGWQRGIQEGAADWDEDWDKLEEEGFSFVKELTLEVQNVTSPAKEKSSTEKKEVSACPKKGHASLSNADSGAEKIPSVSEDASEKEPASEYLDVSDSDIDKRQLQDDSNVSNGIEADALSRLKVTSDHDHDDGKFTVSASSGANFDSDYETGSVSNSNPDNGKEMDYEKRDIGFGLGFDDDFSIKPIKTGSINPGDLFPGEISLSADSIPSTPANADNVFAGKPSLFADSVPSTPVNDSSNTYDVTKKPFFDDSVPNTPTYGTNLFPEKQSFFDDSVPNTPAYTTSDFGAKDSDNNVFSLSHTDSMRSTSEPDPFNSRFDSFNYQRYDSFNTQSFDSSSNVPDSEFPQTPKTSLTRFDSIGSTKDSDYSHGFAFDDRDN